MDVLTPHLPTLDGVACPNINPTKISFFPPNPKFIIVGVTQGFKQVLSFASPRTYLKPQFHSSLCISLSITKNLTEKSLISRNLIMPQLSNQLSPNSTGTEETPTFTQFCIFAECSLVPNHSASPQPHPQPPIKKEVFFVSFTADKLKMQETSPLYVNGRRPLSFFVENNIIFIFYGRQPKFFKWKTIS